MSMLHTIYLSCNFSFSHEIEFSYSYYFSICYSCFGRSEVFIWQTVSFRKKITRDHLFILAFVAFKSSCSFIFLRNIRRIFIEFFGLLCFNEVANSKIEGLIKTPVGLDLFIKKLKTDQGDYVSNSRNSNSMICPVNLTQHYLNYLGYNSGYLLPTLKGRIHDSQNQLCYVTRFA